MGIMDATVECIVLIGECLIAPHAPLDAIVQVGIIKHQYITVQPASILTTQVQ